MLSPEHNLYFAPNSDELPVQLTLPRALHEAKNRQQLSSLALLGQEFWRYPMASPKPATTTTSNSAGDSPTQQLKTESSSGIGTTIFSSAVVNNNVHHNNNNNLMLLRNGSAATTPATTTTTNMFSPTSNTNPLGSNVFSQAGTPSDTTSSLSSFTTSGTTAGHLPMLMSPESMDSVVLTMSPVDVATGRTGIVGKTSTFKALQQNRRSMDLDAAISASFAVPMNGVEGVHNNNNNNNEMSMRGQRPTPPCTLNLGPLRCVCVWAEVQYSRG